MLKADKEGINEMLIHPVVVINMGQKIIESVNGKYYDGFIG